MDPELARMRRFALGIALVLFTWAVAGIELEHPVRITPFGLGFKIGRSDLLPLGIALATIYSCLRFYYYGLMLGVSPYRRRRDLLDQLRGENQALGPSPKPSMYWGPSDFTSTPWRDDYEEVDKLATEIKAAFPKFAGDRVEADRLREVGIEDNETPFYALRIHVPTKCRAAALLQDIDYTSPVWFGALAFGLWLKSLL